MIQLKKKIKTIPSLPPKIKEKTNFIGLLMLIPLLTLIILGIYFVKPYINAVDIKYITGKKTAITECNTKNYIIINKDKSYSMELTNHDCKTQYYEGSLIIKNNEIIFEKNLSGFIDKEYNIRINNITFEREKTNE